MNLTWHTTSITKEQRAKLKGQKPCVLWLTGLSGSGKSTLANALESRLFSYRIHSYLLDGDNIRMGLNSDLGFCMQSRVENLRRIGEVCKLFVDSGLIVLCAFVSPFIKDREKIRNLFSKDEFIEIFVDTPLEVCETRDVKGLYKKARNGDIKDFTGISSPYELPIKPDIHITSMDLYKNVDIVLSYLKEQKIIQAI